MGQRCQFAALCLVLGSYMTSLLGLLPSFSEYLVQRSCRELAAQDCGSSKVSASANQWYLLFLFCVNFSSFVATGFCTALSDHYGRRPVIIVAMVSATMWAGSVFVAVVFDLSLFYILPFWILAGLTGGLGTMLSVSFSIVADKHTAHERPRRFALLSGIAFYFAGVVGPSLSGQLLKYKMKLRSPSHEAQFHLVFLVQLGLLALGTLVAVLFLEESLQLPVTQEGQEERSLHPQRSVEPIHVTGRVQGWLAWYCRLTFGTLKVLIAHQNLFVLSIIFSLFFFLQAGIFAVLPMYAELSSFNLNKQEVGFVLSLQSASNFLAIFCILTPFLSWMQRRNARSMQALLDETIANTLHDDNPADRNDVLDQSALGQGQALLWGARAGAALAFLGCISYGLIPYFNPPAALFISSGLQGTMSILDPSLRSLLSLRASEQEIAQGSVLGGLGVLQALVNIIASPIWNGIYGISVDWLPPLCFYVGAGFAAMAFLLTFHSSLRTRSVNKAGASL